MSTTYAKANDVDLDHVFEIRPDGTITDGPQGLRAPSVYHVEGAASPHDIDVQAAHGDRWEPLTGYTRQQGYRGAVLHASEYLGGGLERDMLATPGLYVAVVVEVLPEDPDADENEEPAGWAVLRYLGHDQDCRYCAAGEPMNHTYEPGAAQ